MRTFLAGGLLLIGTTLPVSVLAQQGTPVGQDKIPANVKVDDPAQVQVEFTDPGNQTAKAVAAASGISVGEATSRLRTQARSAALIARLEAQFPETFAGVEFTSGPAMRVRALFKPGGAPQSAVAAAARETGIDQPVEIGTAALSQRDERQFSGRFIAALRSAGKSGAWFQVDPVSGAVNIGANEDATLRRAAEDAGQGLPIKVGFDPTLKVEETTYAVAGQEWNASQGTSSEPNGCTTGFSVYTGGYYTTTAGHCSNYRAEFNIYTDTSYGSPGGNGITYVNQYRQNGVDVQWYAIAEAGDETSPHYWNGSYSTGITGSFKTYPGNGTDLCKFGRTTKWDCGKVNGSIYNGTYGGPFYIVESTAVSMSEGGDSGGPVVQGTIAYGWIHGYVETSRRMVYTTVKNVYDYTSLRLTICTTSC
jgi:hypothetical protein